eukprot:jgi/Undpi1/3783/HiC_scaffold_16.g07152.m1
MAAREAPMEGLALTAKTKQLHPLEEGCTGSPPDGSGMFSRSKCVIRSAKTASDFPKTATDTAPAKSKSMSMPPLLPRAPSSSTPTKLDPTSACSEPPATRRDSSSFDELLATCISKLGVPGGRRARESLRSVLQAWGEKRTRETIEVSAPREGRPLRRSKQRPSLPAEARGKARRNNTATAPGLSHGQDDACAGSPLLAVCGSQVDSSQHKGRLVGLAEAAAARWERRYSQQVAATEEALLAARNANISVRELKRVLGEERAEAAKAAEKAAADFADGAGGAAAGGEADGEANTASSLGSVAIRERCQAELNRRLRETQEKLAAAENEGASLRQALEKAEINRALQPVVVGLGQVITEGLASLGLVRGVPDEEFHACVSALRDQAEKAGQGFLSAEGLNAAAEGARALDENRSIRAQLHEALVDASRQRARRIEADARLMEKRTGEMARAHVKEDVVNAQKVAEETRARLAVATAEIQRLRELLKEERERSAAMAGLSKVCRAAPIANVRGIFEEGHRLVQAKMKIKVGGAKCCTVYRSCTGRL